MLEHFSNHHLLSHRRRRQHRHCFPFLWQEVFVDNLTLSFNLWETTCDHTGTWKCRAVYQYLGRTDDIDYWCRQQLTVSSEQHSPLPLSLQDSSTRVQSKILSFLFSVLHFSDVVFGFPWLICSSFILFSDQFLRFCISFFNFLLALVIRFFCF